MATNFEEYTHEQLLAMIASLDAETVKTRAAQLADAAKAIQKIGESLKKHQVKGWEGEAAQTFQTWVSQAGSATLRLADYSEAGSKWMTHAAQTMIEVKANTPKYDTAAASNLESAHRFHNDPDAQTMGRTAFTKLNGDHQQAVQQLTKLAQSYEASTTQLNKAEAPTFPPPPKVFEPESSFESVHVDRSSGGSGGGSGVGAGGAPYALTPVGDGASSDGHGRVSALPTPPSGAPSPTPVSTPALPDRDVDVDLNHVATLPDRVLPSPTGMPSVGPVGPGGGGLNPVVTVPPLALPPTAGLKGPGGGALSLPSTRPPTGIGGGKVVGLPPRDTGIVGGRPISPGAPSAGIPRGTVIGAEGSHPVGRGMGGSMGGGLGGTHGPSGSPPVARRLATEPGGVVGGRQPAAGGRSVTGGQPFTQGGSGLVRNNGAMGHAGAGTHTPGKRSGLQRGSRPDYLAEDDETWQGDRRVVPPVID
ncbi:hypothetical protein [Streptomyces sp. NPDC029003]|uniref:WXG100 family type VII secretion target n=1 Tax=Streptomyces sp. NPDC029003 TaxID=3155125 RepID=UPI0034010C4A